MRITPEIRCQSEIYLPLAAITRAFFRLYDHSLAYPPCYTSSPFHTALSWADLYTGLPCWLQATPDPSRLLELLLTDHGLHTRFLFYSFLPDRYNGIGFARYPGQAGLLRTLLRHWRQSGKQTIRCLDAACGSGEGTWELVELLASEGWQPEQAWLEGWTIEPLEVYAATKQYLPHNPGRQQTYRQRTAPLMAAGWAKRTSFRAVDLVASPASGERFDLILCNGLLGGPIIHRQDMLSGIITKLTGMLPPGGCLAAADRFHAGWKKKTPEEVLRGLFVTSGLRIEQGGEGITGIRT